MVRRDAYLATRASDFLRITEALKPADVASVQTGAQRKFLL